LLYLKEAEQFSEACPIVAMSLTAAIQPFEQMAQANLFIVTMKLADILSALAAAGCSLGKSCQVRARSRAAWAQFSEGNCYSIFKDQILDIT
jgi:hypothetical protein